jgi:ankyrin repeat protein
VRQQRRKGQWHPLLKKLMVFAIRDARLARKLVKDHPEVLTLRTGLGETAPHYLAVENYADGVQLLIDLGAEVNVQNEFGDSAIYDAKRASANEAVAVLRRAGACETRGSKVD